MCYTPSFSYPLVIYTHRLQGKKVSQPSSYFTATRLIYQPTKSTTVLLTCWQFILIFPHYFCVWFMTSIKSKRAVSMAVLDSSFDADLTHGTRMGWCVKKYFHPVSHLNRQWSPRWNLKGLASNKQTSLSQVERPKGKGINKQIFPYLFCQSTGDIIMLAGQNCQNRHTWCTRRKSQQQ